MTPARAILLPDVQPTEGWVNLVFSAYGLLDSHDEREAKAGVEDAIAGQTGAWKVIVLWQYQFQAYTFRIKRDGELLADALDARPLSQLTEPEIENTAPQDGRSKLRQAFFDKVRMLTRPA